MSYHCYEKKTISMYHFWGYPIDFLLSTSVFSHTPSFSEIQKRGRHRQIDRQIDREREEKRREEKRREERREKREERREKRREEKRREEKRREEKTLR